MINYLGNEETQTILQVCVHMNLINSMSVMNPSMQSTGVIPGETGSGR